jgi:hypothetical protein
VEGQLRLESAETRIERLEAQVDLWRAENDRQAEREQALRAELAHAASENRRLAERQAAAEQRVGQLAQLQAATLQLHEARQPADVLTTIKEIVANLVGSEEMGIYARRPDGSMQLLDGIGDTAASDFADAVVCIPLLLDGQPLGVIAIFRLLPQKAGLEPVDHELFALLSRHAALALHHAELRV